ncbi:MAG TPA: ribulose-phosphate 3-epimerase [Candidatus Scybalousia intestinigallinarum]|nr:ribulose-phosphate 3-epimerase [Candidatus Scybalousia intestinigallinarum]
MKVSASFLTCRKIEKAIEKLSLTDVDYIHVDFVDNTFCQGKKIPIRRLKKIYRYTAKRLDVHLMVNKPKKYIKQFVKLNAEMITFPIEIEKDIEKNLNLIKKYGLKCGLSINPDTNLHLLEKWLDKIDLVLVMGVNPGYGGQEFIPEVKNRVEIIRKMITEHQSKTLLSLDGGINQQIVKEVSPFVDIIVSGSYITNADDYQEQIDILRGKEKQENTENIEIKEKNENLSQ